MKKALLIVSLSLLSLFGFAQISVGETSDFEIDIEGWEHQLSNAFNPVVVSTGGPNGVDDGYLSTESSGTSGAGSRHLFVNDNPEWIGNYTSAGIVALTFDVRNPNATDLHLRVAVQGATNRWAASANAVIVPANSGWISVSIPMEASDLTLSANPSTSIATILTEVSQIRILHNDGGDTLHKGQVAALMSDYDNITAVSSLSTLELNKLNTEFTISPNPAKTKLNIILPSNDEVKLEVFDVLGKRVYNGAVSQLSSSIDVSNWRSGVYLVRVSNDKETQTKRFIKQ